MATRKVYGSLSSPATLKVLACLFEHHLDFDFIPINLDNGEHKVKPFLDLSPFGKVPVYEDGGNKQWEVGAIIRGMAHEHGQRKKTGEELIFWDPRKQAIVANWVDVEDHEFEPPALDLISELLIKPKNGLDPDVDVVAKAESKLIRVLDIYEARLAKLNYLACNKFTIVDLLHLPNLQSLVGITLGKKLLESRPRVMAWCSDILARPSWAKVLEMQH